MYEIAILELEVVNSVALKIATNKSIVPFAELQRSQAMSVIIDEAYHAYVAFDYIKQAELLTGVKSIHLPNESAVSTALKKHAPRENAAVFTLLELISVCLSEHVLTKDIVYLKHETNVCKFFMQTMQDHLLDEGRHASFFAEILNDTWIRLDDLQRSLVANYVPHFIDIYISNDVSKEHDRKILMALGFNQQKIDEIIYDTYLEQDKNLNINVQNFMQVLSTAGLLEHAGLQTELQKNGYRLP